MTDIKYPEETRQANQAAILDKLTRLQAKAKRKKRAISLHGFARDNQSEGNTGDYPDYMRPINGQWC